MNLDNLTLIIEEENQTNSKYKHMIHICAGTGCASAKSMDLLKNLNTAIKSKGVDNTIQAKMVGCMGLCAEGPVVSILPDDILYGQVGPEDAQDIIDALIN
jgi:NADH:ubiquinone oxidoreductase subunit E